MNPPTVRLLVTTYRVVDDGHGGSTRDNDQKVTDRWFLFDAETDGNLSEWLADIVVANVGQCDIGERGNYYGTPQRSTDGTYTEPYASFRDVPEHDSHEAARLIAARLTGTRRQ